jgi:putative ABC transport system permease protein
LTVVLGSVAAARLGIDHVDPAKPPQVWIGGQRFTVIGVLGPVPLAPEIECSVLVGWNAASAYLGFDGHPTTVYARADESEVDNVRQVVGRTLNPQAPNEVAVRRPRTRWPRRRSPATPIARSSSGSAWSRCSSAGSGWRPRW